MKSVGCLVLLFALTLPLAAQEKLIALTFDDGPRPYVLYGNGSPGLLDVLDRNGVKATFFLMGWRLTPGTYGDRRETRIGKTCLEGAKELHRRGHQLENHTFSHVHARAAKRQHGEAWVVGDIEKASALIQGVTGARPRFVRPPQWVMWPELRTKIESRGYRVMTINASDPDLIRDVNSNDYLCAGSNPVNCPKPALAESVMRQIERREKKGLSAHVLVFHELTTSTAALQVLLPQLKARGYRFVTLNEYVKRTGFSNKPVVRAAAP